MPIDRPSDYPDWASGATEGLDLIEPETPKQVAGFVFEEPPTYQLVNWLWNRVARWVSHLGAAVSWFPDLPSMHDAAQLAVGNGSQLLEEDTALVGPFGGGTAPGEEVGTAVALGVDDIPLAIAVSGRSVVLMYREESVAGDLVVKRWDADLTNGTEIYRLGGGPFPGLATAALLNDGTEIVFGASPIGAVRCHDHDTGTLKWSATYATPLNLAWSHNRVYVVGTVTGAQCRALNRSTGGTVWSFNHNADLYHCVYHGARPVRLIVWGVASGHASGATIRSINANTGADLTNEGGNGTDTNMWDNTSPPAPLTGWYGGLRLTDRAVIAVRFNSGSGSVWRVSPVDGLALKTINVATILNGDTDHRYLYTCEDTRGYARSLDDLGLAWGFDINLSNYSLVASDGHVVYFVTVDGSPQASIRRFSSSGGTDLFRYVDPSTTERLLPWRRTVVPARDSGH